MKVIKRNGKSEEVRFDLITDRLKNLLKPNLNIDPIPIAQKVTSRLRNNMTTRELDDLSSQICMNLSEKNPEYGVLAARIAIDNHQKNTKYTLLQVVEKLYNNVNITGKKSPLISKELYDIVQENSKVLEQTIDYSRDFLFDYFGFCTLLKAYLLKVKDEVIERPQHLWMRVAIGLHSDNIPKVIETYENMSRLLFTHATPTLFHAGTPRPQLASCFLLGTEDSVHGIYKTITDCAKISKWAGGIGCHISNIRAQNSYISSTGGKAGGILPMLKVYNYTAKYINQCFAGNTIVYTTDGPKCISDVCQGDYVITLDSTPKPVMALKRQDVDKEVIKIKVKCSDNFVKVTPEHEIYVLRPTPQMIKDNNIIDQIKFGNLSGTYIPANEINENDMLCYPIPKINKTNDVPKDIARFYGLMIENGCLTCKQNITEGCISIKYKQKKVYLFIKSFLEKRNLKYLEHIENKEHIENNIVTIKWDHSNSDFITYDDLYNQKHQKRISSRFLKMDRNSTLSMVQGLIETTQLFKDGIYFHTTNTYLKKSLQYCLLRLGILTVGYTKNQIGSELLCIPIHPIIASLFNIKPSKQFGFFQHENKLYSKIDSISKEHFTGTVYDLNIADNHNYLTQMGVVHNSGRRPGSFAMYLEPWHSDIFQFLDAKKNHGNEEEKARDLFYALWIPDAFMRAVEKNDDWYLMCPDQCPGLTNAYGKDFDELYYKYVREGKFFKKVKARDDVWNSIISTQIESGLPYMLYKDACNQKSNQKNLGTIKSSNLCVAPETKILTDQGHVEIQTLKNKKINVWNGTEYSEVIVKQTNEQSELITVSFSDGSDLTCTKYHKFYIQDKYTPKNKDVIRENLCQVYEAQNLKKDMKIIKCRYPIIDNNHDLESAYTNGFFSGDGTYRWYVFK
jgi:ribonucleoside-diphosphate reductase alpha chain